MPRLLTAAVGSSSIPMMSPDERAAAVNAGVIAGTYTTPTLAPGAARLIKIAVKARNNAPADATLAARSVADPTVSDTVGFVTSRR